MSKINAQFNCLSSPLDGAGAQKKRVTCKKLEFQSIRPTIDAAHFMFLPISFYCTTLSELKFELLLSLHLELGVH
jgi:hypothetical protein